MFINKYNLILLKAPSGYGTTACILNLTDEIYATLIYSDTHHIRLMYQLRTLTVTYII